MVPQELEVKLGKTNCSGLSLVFRVLPHNEPPGKISSHWWQHTNGLPLQGKRHYTASTAKGLGWDYTQQLSSTGQTQRREDKGGKASSPLLSHLSDGKSRLLMQMPLTWRETTELKERNYRSKCGDLPNCSILLYPISLQSIEILNHIDLFPPFKMLVKFSYCCFHN